ncbi:MAG: hypothetical protein K0V04_36665 [Deltaproteobacteria bacterium]|nr:hypothetical protein [Deltaproteobacteria bacterium]
MLPQPGGRSLLVQVVDSSGGSLGGILERLGAVRGRLREQIAAAIHRKRTPQLHFMVLPAVVVLADEDGEP